VFRKNNIKKLTVLINSQLNYVVQLIKYNAECTSHGMAFNSKETEIKLLLNAQI